MTFIPTLDGAKAVVKFSVGTEGWSNVLWFTKVNFVQADMVALADKVDAQVQGIYLPLAATDVMYVGTDVYDMRTDTGGMVTNIDGAGIGTSGDADVLPLNVACVVTHRTASRGRSARGRSYWAGFGESKITDGTFIAAISTGLVNLMNGIHGQAASIGWTMIVRSTQHAGQVRNPADVYPVTSFTVRSLKAATQRRRVDRP